jgi:putative transcriptional regulator
LKEAIAIARGEERPAKLFAPPEIDVKAIRAKLQLSQEDFASAFDFTIRQIRQWEQAQSRPLGVVRVVYLMIIDRDPSRFYAATREAAMTAFAKSWRRD